MEGPDLTPFRISKQFEQHVPELVEAMKQDPDGMYQMTYRVGQVVVSAHLWREPEVEPLENLSEFDRNFLKGLNVCL